MTRLIRSRQRGLTLIEALIAFLVLSLGMLAVARLQPQLRQHAELARQRSEALRLAHEDIERLRGFATLGSVAGLRSFAEIADTTRELEPDATASNTRYRLVRRSASVAASAAQVDVTVDWLDRSGTTQQVALTTLIAASDPALAGSLTLAPRSVAVKGMLGRSALIPIAAKDLGDGRSVLKPVSGGTEAIVFDNTTGAVTERCTGIAAATATRDLSAADLSACTRAIGMLLSGEIRFSSAMPPLPTGNDMPLSLSVALDLSGPAPSVAPWCSAEAMKTVAYARAGSRRIDAVPIAAMPASLGLAEWTELGERFVAYHCVVIPEVGLRRWSGRTTLVPSGWTIGMGAADWRVCRFSADQDGSGAIDTNLEHPAIYQNVDRALARQNFLVISGSATCPASTTRLATVPHQPA